MAVENLDKKFEELLLCAPLVFGELPVRMPSSGVYLFSEAETHLYVGRSNTLRDRYHLHCRWGSQQNQATFAYKLAREALSIGPATYKSDSSGRRRLASDPAFVVEFEAAKKRIRKMEYRFVEERDQTCQALLEAYCAIVLETPYNDFETH